MISDSVLNVQCIKFESVVRNFLLLFFDTIKLMLVFVYSGHHAARSRYNYQGIT